MKATKTIFDYSRLRGKIKEVCDTQDEFARRMGMGRVTISQRLNNLLEFTADEMIRACDILGIDYIDIPYYFFTVKV